jgi:hypothetical protein
MPHARQVLSIAALLCLGAGACLAQVPATPTPDQAAFFETRVRPVLAERCYDCHGSVRQSAGLRLDSRAAILQPTEKGHLPVVPGSPAQSALILAVRYDGAVKMPPQGKLSAREIDALTQWVKMGAPWPVAAVHETHEGEAALLAAARSHWSLQPVAKPTPSAVRNSAWVRNPIDAFIAAAHEAKGLAPARPADRRTLLRRVTYDLTGLPPTAAEIASFVADASPAAYEKVVDRLLASPRYGERWGRCWLDIARYADTRGAIQPGLQGDESRYPFAYTYRDWVVRSLNEDLPYDRFLLCQIAADQLPLGDDRRDLAALGFLTLGPRSINGEPDVMDDRIDVVMRGTQALTVTCARCHDHKFDPIPTKDYYSLYGVFSAAVEKTVPLLAGPDAKAAMAAFEREKQAREARVTQLLRQKQAEIQSHTRAHFADYLLAAADPIETSGAEETVSGLKLGLIARWRAALTAAKTGGSPVLAPWTAFAALPYSRFAVLAPAVAARCARNADGRTNTLIAKLFTGPAPRSLGEVAARYARALAAVDARWQQSVRAAEARGAAPPAGLLNPTEEEIRRFLDADAGVAAVPTDQVETYLNEKDRARVQSLRRSISQLMSSPAAPPHALVLEDISGAESPRVFLRGNQGTPGEAVPRRFLLCLAGEKREPFKQGSGRLELAQDIASPDNPLTARVIVNRVWLGHFGQGIVRTPSDFGARGEPPTHPELLDWLAATFMESGWSLKKLHRLILLSNAYQQSDEDNPANRKIDPDNRLVWRMNRRRLDFEEMRDTLLTAGGGIDDTMGGRSVEITGPPFTRRRTLYAMVDRSNLPSMYRVFDFANPDAHTAERFVTTSPQKSLFLLNSPFVVEQARGLAARTELSGVPDDRARIGALYQLVYGRSPTDAEVMLGEGFLKSAIVRARTHSTGRPSPWQYGYGEVDEAAKRVRSFTALPYWTGEMWQAGIFLPEPDFGGLSLDAGGGTPGSDRSHAAIRRWVAPRDGVVSVSGQIKHVSMNGDGVHARIVSSRSGVVGEWRVFYTFKETAAANIAVKQGDTLDFVVDCGDDDVEDRFLWAPTVALTAGPAEAQAPRKTRFREAAIRWSAMDDFGGPAEETARPLTALEKYAQVLLLSNEFAFVD